MSLPGFAIADFLIETDLKGLALAKELRARFSDASRYDFALGVSLYATDTQIDLLVADAELEAARRELRDLRSALTQPRMAA